MPSLRGLGKRIQSLNWMTVILVVLGTITAFIPLTLFTLIVRALLKYIAE